MIPLADIVDQWLHHNSLELLEFVDDVVDELDSRKEVEYILNIMANGTGADRQLEVYKKTNDLKAVVEFIIKETYIGLDLK